MQYGIIKIPVTDLRSGPDSAQERLSQALFGTPVKIGSTQKGFSRVVLPEGYRGWCRSGHIEPVTKNRLAQYAKRRKIRVKAASVRVRGPVYGPKDQFLLYLGTELIVSSSAGETRFEMPGGGMVRISQSALKMQVGKNRKISGRIIINTSRIFLGTPYLWGGISPAGIDCSGLVQMVYRFHGLELARDSRDQRREGIAVKRDSVRAGDLLFFPGHVALSCGGNRFIHASAQRGMTVIDSFDSEAPNYRPDLDRGFEFARRIIP
ncbi:MAG: C40 family peptidase [FCB group bacterium]|nr:C40 family peptidase [FCB group bacterium]